LGRISNIELIKMPLPDTNNWSSRIYELLKETDLENLSYAQFQGVAEKLFIEPENEDELRRLVLVQLARMAVRGDWDGFLSGGSGGAPTNADYLLAYDQGTVPTELTNARKLVVGNNISMAHGAGDNDDMTISATPGGSDGQIQYNVAGVLAATGLLSTNKTNELTLVAISGDGQINISSSSKAVSLLCDENQKLKVKGATDTFILDVSSSSGGITFPDGTTQTTAASGGGAANFPTPLGNFDATYKYLNIGTAAPYGVNCSTVSARQGDYALNTRPRCFPFIAPASAAPVSMSIIQSTTGTGTATVGIYSANSDNYPDTLVATGTYDPTSTGTKTVSNTLSTALVAGELYFFCVRCENSGGNLEAVKSEFVPSIFPGFSVSITATNTCLTLNNITSGTALPTTAAFGSGNPSDLDRLHMWLEF